MSEDRPAGAPHDPTTNIQLRRCPRCSQPVAPGSRFCSSCGAALPEDGDDTGMLPAVEESGPIPVVNPDVVAGLNPGDAVLLVHRGPNQGTRFELVASPVTVGRAPDATIFLDDVTVSRQHADFARVPTGWELVDAGSLNGTYVNRNRIDRRLLAPGDEIQIGKYRFLYFQASAS